MARGEHHIIIPLLDAWEAEVIGYITDTAQGEEGPARAASVA